MTLRTHGIERLTDKVVVTNTRAFLLSIIIIASLSSWRPCSAAENDSDVKILSHSSYVLYESYLETWTQQRYKGEFFHVVGELQNTGEQNIQLDRVNATYYDSEGSVIEGPKTYALWIETLTPSQKAPFATILLDENASKRVVYYELSVIYHATQEEPYQDLLILSQRFYNDSDPVRRWYQSGVIGEVIDTDIENLEGVGVIATLYDKDGSIIGFVANLVEFTLLVPGQKSPFDVPFVNPSLGHIPLDVIERLNSYQLYAYCSLSDKIPYRDFQILGHSHEELLEYSTWKYIVKGEVKNVGSQAASAVVVIATFYDDSGRPIDFYPGYIGDLDPGETSTFEVDVVADSKLYIADYALQVECWEYREKTKVDISCSVLPSSITYGEDVEVLGALSPPKESITVTMNYLRPDGDSVVETTTTTINGSYLHTYKPDIAGFWRVKASWSGDEEHSRAESQSKSFQVRKIFGSISLSLEDKTINEGEFLTLHGKLEPPLADTSLNLTITRPDLTTNIETITIESDGTFTYTFKPEDTGDWKVVARWSGDSSHESVSSSQTSFKVKEKNRCIIATVTYGSELAPEVTFLRNFRSQMSQTSFTGYHFIRAFNSFYYSFSPQIADFIARHSALRQLVKYALTPFLGIIRITALTFNAFNFHEEAQAIISLMFASSLIGITYLSVPLTGLLHAMKKTRMKTHQILVFLVTLLINLTQVAVAIIINSPIFLIIATSLLVIFTMGFSATVCSMCISAIIQKGVPSHIADRN